jgi:hypothetical protein
VNRKTCVDKVLNNSVELYLELRQFHVSDERFEPSTEALRACRDAIKGKRKIEREIAATLHEMEIAFISALDHNHWDTEKQAAIRKAHETFVPV